MEQREASRKDNAIAGQQSEGAGIAVEKQFSSSGSDVKSTSVLTADGLGWPGTLLLTSQIHTQPH